jgi:iron(III) transport system permease protein
MVLVTGADLVPGMFLMLSAAFRNMDAQLEESGRASGASTLQVTRRVTMPLMLPSLGAAGIYYLILLLEIFEIPLILGPNANFPVLSTYIFRLVQSSVAPPQYGMAAAFGTLAIILGVALALVYSLINRRAFKYAVVKGQRQARGLVRLGVWKYVVIAGVALYLLLSNVLPILSLVWTSLFPRFTAVTAGAFSEMSLNMYSLVFADARWRTAALNTVLVVGGACIATALIGMLSAWVVVRNQNAWVRWLDALTFLPRAVPGVIIAVGVFLLTIRTPIYGTVAVIFIGHTISYLPYVSRLLTSTLLQIDKELEDAARASGARTHTVFGRIVMPLMRPALVNSVLWVAAHSFRDFTYALILGTAANQVVALFLWQSWSIGDAPRTSAMAVIMIVVVLIIAVPARYRLGKGLPA